MYDVSQQPTVINTCRVCGNKPLKPVLSFGEQHISNFVKTPEEDGPRVPLELVLCDAANGGCGLLQLHHTTPPEWMYKYYWYKSGINESMVAALRDITNKAQQLIRLDKGDVVVDIGANDGTLLRAYTVPNLALVGFEPAENLIPSASIGTTKIINDFFSYGAYQHQMGEVKPKVITAIAMFYDLDDPNAFVAGIKQILHPEGVFIIQMAYLTLMLETNNFDNVCHEHLAYYSLLSLDNLLRRHDLEIFDVELNDVNGGSYRVYVCHKGAGVLGFSGAQQRLDEITEHERRLGLNSIHIYSAFAQRVAAERKALVDFLRQEAKRGKRIYAYGASTKGNMLLQYYGLGHEVISKIADRNPDKWGKMTVGTHIPIVSEDEARQDKPDYFLVLPWHFLRGFLVRERSYLEGGGKFVVPLPKFRVIGSADLMPSASGSLASR